MSTVPERRAVKTALRQAGLSARQVDALLRHGWRALVGETRAEADELHERVAALAAQFQLANAKENSHD